MNLTINDFSSLVFEISDLSIWSDFTRNQFTYTEWLQLSTEEKKDSFKSYTENVSAEELIEQEYWVGIFKSEPIVKDNFVIGEEED